MVPTLPSRGRTCPKRWYHAPFLVCDAGARAGVDNAAGCIWPSGRLILPFPPRCSPDNSTFHVRKIFGLATASERDSSKSLGSGTANDATEFSQGSHFLAIRTAPRGQKVSRLTPHRDSRDGFVQLYSKRHVTGQGALGGRARLKTLE